MLDYSQIILKSIELFTTIRFLFLTDLPLLKIYHKIKTAKPFHRKFVYTTHTTKGQ